MEVLEEKPISVQLCPPQIPHEMDWNRKYLNKDYQNILHISNKKLENEHSASSSNVPNNTLFIEEKHMDTTKFNVSFRNSMAKQTCNTQPKWLTCPTE